MQSSLIRIIRGGGSWSQTNERYLIPHKVPKSSRPLQLVPNGLFGAPMNFSNVSFIHNPNKVGYASSVMRKLSSLQSKQTNNVDGKKRWKNRKIILDRTKWEKILMTPNGTSISQSEDQILQEKSEHLETDASQKQDEILSIIHSERLDLETQSTTMSVDSYLEEGSRLLKIKDSWTNEDSTTALSVLHGLLETFHHFTYHNTNRDEITNNQTTSSQKEKYKFPWRKPNFLHTFQNSSYSKHDPLLTSIQLTHRLLSSSIPFTVETYSQIANFIIPAIIKEWSIVAASSKRWNLMPRESPQQSAETLEYLVHAYISILQRIQNKSNHQLEQPKASNAEDTSDTQIDINWNPPFDFQCHNQILEQLDSKEQDNIQNTISLLYEALINAWGDSASSSTKFEYLAGEKTSFYLNNLYEHWRISPSIQMYRKVIYTWSYLVQRTLNAHRHKTTKVGRRRKTKKSFSHNSKPMNTNTPPEMSVVKQLQDILDLSSKDFRHPLDKNSESDPSYQYFDVGMYNAVLSTWANVSSILGSHKFPHASFVTDISEMSQALLDNMDRKETLLTPMQGKRYHFYVPDEITPNSTSYKAVLISWTHAGSAHNANLILNRMEKDTKCHPNISCYSMVLKAFMQNPDDVNKLPEQLEEILYRAESNATQVLSRTNILLNDKQRTDPMVPNEYFYSSIIHAWANSKFRSESDIIDAAKRAEAILDKMKRAFEAKSVQHAPNAFCYEGVISAWANSGTIGHERATLILDDMVENHLEMNQPKNKFEKISVNRSFTTVIGLLGKSPQSQHAIEAIDKILVQMEQLQDLGWMQPDAIIITSIMDAWKRQRDSDVNMAEDIEELLKELQSKFQVSRDPAVRPNVKTLNSAIDAWIQCSVKHPESISTACEKVEHLLEWAESLFQNNQNNSIRPGVRQYNMFISMIRRNKMDPSYFDRIPAIKEKIKMLQENSNKVK